MYGPLHTPESARAEAFADAARLRTIHPGWIIRDDAPFATRAGVDIQADTWTQLGEKLAAEERVK
jgi:hypothetical protein